MINTAENLRFWLRECPAISNVDQFGVDFMGQSPTEYAIYSSPSALNYVRDILGNLYLADPQELNYTFVTLCPFSMDILQNLQNLGFFEQVRQWIMAQNRAISFPEIAEGRVISILPTLTPYVFDADSDSGRYQIQLKIKYHPYNE